MLRLFDIGFAVLHTILILFNLCGWAFPRTRRLHLFTITLTLGSWVGLGLKYGFGYCPSTDWHWQLKRQLGEVDLPASWVKYYVDWMTNTAWDAGLVDGVVAVAGIGAFLVSVAMNYRDYASKRKDARETAP